MSDNTQLNPAQGGGDVIRSIDRSADSTPIAAKTQVVQVDIGGESNELLLTPGQQSMAGSIPVVLASQHTDSSGAVLGSQIPGAVQAAGPNGKDMGAKLDLIYAELRLITRFLQMGLGMLEDEPDTYRSDPSYLDFQ